MFTLFLIIIVVVSVGIILAIIIRKVPAIKSVNPKAAPVIQQMTVKQQLIRKRLERHIKDGGQKTFIFLKPALNQIALKLRQGYQKLIDLEEEYRHKVLKASFKDKVVQEQKIDEIIKEAEVLTDQEKYQEAEKKYIEALTLDEQSSEAYGGLGKLYLLQKDYEHAKETFEFLMSLDDSDPFVYRSLGEISADRGDLKTAEDEYLKSLELNSKDISVYIDLAQVYLNLEEPHKAFEIIGQAATQEPKNPKILDFLIEISIILQDKVAAKKALKALKEANPENQKLDEFKHRIEEL